MNYIDILESAIEASAYPLDAKFALYNRLCFGGELPETPLSFKRLKNLGGLCSCKFTRRGSEKTLVPGSVHITLDRTYLRDEQAIDAILIHEMIHAWFYYRNDMSENHGMKFMAMRRKCQTIVGFDIPVTEKMDNAVLADVPVKPVVVLVREFTDNKPAYLVTNPAFFARKGAELGQVWQSRNFYADRRLTAYEIATPMWSQKAAQLPAQRPANFMGAKFWMLDPAMEADLKENGRVLLDLQLAR